MSHLVHELAPPSHVHSESWPEGQRLLQAPPDGGGDGASQALVNGWPVLNEVIYPLCRENDKVSGALLSWRSAARA